ncbi:MAG TPA: phage major capsid protein [Candidatus Saccharimonadales bacterium]|nr:phage major capsid protein [Candidatus Saccharimonadales bacterium]
MQNLIRRDLHPTTIRVIDGARGTVEYISSDETIDGHGEAIKAAGWQFNRFQKNAPFVDSHSYDSIDTLLGKVIDSKIVNRQLVQTVQWAIDVPQNTLAQKGFAMTQAGYLKAVSVGFLPVEIVRRSDAKADWDAACKDLGLGDEEDSVSCIYLKQEQLELSCCIIGANGNAVAKAYRDGILDNADLLRWPSMRRAMQSAQPEPRRSYSFAPSSPNPQPFIPMSKKSFLDRIDQLTGGLSVKQAADKLESARRGQSETQLYRASAMTRTAIARQRRLSVHAMADEILSDSVVRDYLNILPRYIGGISFKGNDLVAKSLTPGSGTFGGTLLPIDVAASVWDLILLNGAFREMGVVSMSAMETKVAQATANPTAYWLPNSLIGSAIPADAALNGSNTTPEANTIAVNVPVSRELLADQKVNLAFYLLTRFSQAIAGAIDFAACQGTGSVDMTSGGQTGMFTDQTITTVNAAQGNNAIAQLARADFLSAVAAVSPAALQRECKWLISPSFIAPLMGLADTQGHSYLLKTPAETGDGSWRLVGFEVVWAAQAPALTPPGSVIAVFGHLPSYLVAIREELEVMLRDGTGFASNDQSFRAIGRAMCLTRASSGLAKLALSN